MRAIVGVGVAVAICATTSSQEQVGIYLDMQGRLMESGLRFSPGGETKYRTSAYMQQLWMAATAQTLATRGEAAGCSSLGWTEEEAGFDCPLGHDDYIFTFTYDAREGSSVLSVYDSGTEAYIGPDQVEDLVWELPGANDRRALERAEIDHIAVTVEVFSNRGSKSRQASGTRHSVDEAVNYATRELGRLVLGLSGGRTTLRDTAGAQLTYRIELKDGQVFEHRDALPATDIEALLTDRWPSHASEARWTLTTQYEARQLKALQAARRQSKPAS